MNLSENTTGSVSEMYAIQLFKVLAFLVALLVGLVTNALSTIVWLRQVKTKPAALFIGCLSLVDALYCLALPASTIVFLIAASFSTDFLQCARYGYKEVSLICADASRLLTIAVIAQRWVAVSKPLLMTRLCTLQRRLIVLTCLVLTIIVVHLFNSYVIWLGEVNCKSFDFKERMKHFLEAYQIVNLIFTLMCFMGIFIFSALLLYSTCKIPQASSSLRSRRWQRDVELRMTVIILCVSSVSMVEFVSSFIYILAGLGFDVPGIDIEVAYEVYYFFIMLIRPVNFFVYSCIGKEFRIKLRSMCTCKCSSILGRQRG